MGRRPDVTVAAIAETDGRFLVVEERINRRLLFNQPAGHVERGETLFAAVVRETREETARGFAFTGRVSDHNPAQHLDRGIIATHWLTREELEARQPRLRSPLVLRCVQDYLAGRRSPLDGTAQLELECAAALGANVAPPVDGSTVRVLEVTAAR